MSIVDFFKPKWKNSDWQIRKYSISHIEDQSILSKIATEDESSEVRIAAIERIEDDNVLRSIAKLDKDASVRIAAIERVEDDNALSSIAKLDTNASVRIAALYQITDSSVRNAALENITDSPLLLAKVTMAANDKSLGLATLERIEDNKLLLMIARNAELPSVSLAAIERIEDSNHLAEIAINSRNKSSRFAALKRIQNEDLLADVTIRSPHNSVRLAAIDRIQDMEVLERAVMGAEFETKEAWEGALARIKDQVALARIVSKTSGTLRNIAFDKITNQDCIMELALSVPENIFMGKALNKISDPAVLAKLIREAPDVDVAIGHISSDRRKMSALSKHINNEANRHGTSLAMENTIEKLAAEKSLEVKQAVDHSLAATQQFDVFSRSNQTELRKITHILDKSLDAMSLVNSAMRIGFTPIGEDFLATYLESRHGRIAITVYNSYSPTDIYGLAYSNRRSSNVKTFTLISEGKRAY